MSVRSGAGRSGDGGGGDVDASVNVDVGSMRSRPRSSGAYSYSRDSARIASSCDDGDSLIDSTFEFPEPPHKQMLTSTAATAPRGGVPPRVVPPSKQQQQQQQQQQASPPRLSSDQFLTRSKAQRKRDLLGVDTVLGGHMSGFDGSAMPMTPSTPFFDAQEGGDRDQHEFAGQADRFFSDAVISSGVPGSSPWQSSEAASQDDVYTEGSLGSLGGTSFNSDADVHGPVTPSTPAWRPRELTLLRSREQVPNAEAERHERERERVLAGLGIRINGAPLPTSSGVTVSQLPSLHGSATPGTSSIPSSSSSAPPSTRVAGRRLSRLIIGSTGPSFSPFSPGAHHLAEQQQQQQQQEHKVAPRELKLSSSGGPPRATTGRGQQSLAHARNRSSVSLSSPIAGPSMSSAVGQWSKLRSPSAPLASGQASSSYAASKSPLQVQPRTPAFVSGHAASTGTRQGEATASEAPAASAMPFEDDERSLSVSEGGADIEAREARRSRRSSKSPSGTPSSSSDQLLPSRGASFAESSSSTRRKKGPPKPLRLGTSSPALASPYTATSATSSSYSRRSSPEDSKRRPMGPVTVVQPSSPDDRSPSEARVRPDQAPDQGYSAFSLSASALTAPASPGAAALFSPISPGFQGFHTPLSSPAVAQDFAAQQQLPAGEEDIESNYRASTIAKESSGKWSPHGAFEFESASSVDSPQLNAPGPETFQAKESVALPHHPVAAANASAAAFVTAEDEDEGDKVLSTSKGADVATDASSIKDEERRAVNLLPSNEPPKPPSPGAKVQFDTTIFHSPPMPTRRMSAQLVGPKEVASAGQSSIKGDRRSNGPVGPPPSMPLPTPPGGATMPRANSRFRASRTRDSVTTTTRQSGGGTAARTSRPPSVAQDIDERAKISKGSATEPLPQSQWKASCANDIVAGGHSENNEDHEERSARVRRVSSTTNIKVREAALEPEPRPRPPVPKTKTSLVPDVPSFAYGAPSSSGSSPLHPPDDQQPSNQAALNELDNLTGETEPQMSSRWSSGSDDDDDEPVKNKDKRLSSKQRKSSMTPMPSALTGTSRKASMGNLSSSGGTVQKKSGFFSGLGLRKKSVPNLGSAYAGSNFSNSPVTPSPSMAKAEAGLKEFPFPDTSSRTNDSRRVSRSEGVSKHTSYAPSSMSFAAAGSHVPADPSSGRFSQQQLQQAPFRRPMAAPLPPQLQNSSSISKGDGTMPKIPVSRSRSRSSQRLSQHDETDAGVSHFTAPLLTTAVNSASLKPKRSDASLGATVSSSSSEGTGRPSLSNDGMSLPSSPRSPDHVVSHQASFSSLKPLSASPKNAPLSPPSEDSRQRSIPGKAEIDLRTRKADDQDAPPSAPARMESRTAQSGRNKKPFEGSSRKDESGQGLDGTATRSAQRQPPQQPPQQIIGRRETQEVRKTTRQDPAPPLNLAAQRRVRSSSNAAFASPNVRAPVALPPSPSRIVSSPDETPRIAYASLPGSEVGSEIGSPQPTRMRFGEQGSADEEALTALGYAFARSGSESHSSEDGRHTSLSSSASSREGGARQPTVPVSLLAPVVEDVGTTPRASVSDELRKRVRVAVKVAKKRTRRVRSEAPLIRPHYPSLTDVGRLWVENNAGLPFNAAHGPRLLAAALRQNSNEHRQDGSATPSESESSTDDYGSSDGGGGGREQEESFGSRGHGTGGGSGGGSGDGGDDGRDKPEGRNNADASLDDVEEEDDRDNEEGKGVEEESDIDSEDSYGSSEIPFPEANEAALDASQLNALGAARPISIDDSKAGESESDSSDDIPLGQRVQDPKQLQNHLRQVERSENIRSARLALEQPSSSSSANSDGRGPGRRARMLRAMQEQQARAVKEQAAMQCGKPSALDVAALSAKLAKVQTEREAGGISEPPSAPIGSSSGQGVISRARSLKNPSSAHRHHLHLQHQAQQQDNSPYAGSEIQRFKSTKSERGPQRADFHAPSSSSSSSTSHAPPPLPTQPPPPHLAAMAGGAPSSAPAANPQSRQASVSNSGTVAQAQALSRINPSARRPVGAGDGASSNGQVSSDGAFVTAPTSARSETDERAVLSGNNSSMLPTVMQHRPRAMSQSRSRAVPPPIDTRIAPPLPQIARMQAVGGGNGSPDGHRGSSSPSQSSISSPRETQGPLPYNSMMSSPPAANREAAIVDTSLSQIAASDLSRNGRQQGSVSSAAAAVEQAMKVAPASRLVQHRVFIVTRQRYSAAEVPLQARARDVVVDVMERETMPTDNRMGAWVLFDVCAELGLERPLREYELISDVIETRANPSVDFFLLKKTELAPYLALRSLPTSSPVVGGYVYVRDSKKKWNKRWLELRDHSLFHAKSEKGKDEVLVCHLSNFDVYLVDQTKIKTPKTHAFALRSQDPISLFESPEQDYMHVLSLSDGGALRHWVTSIINARTYVLKQERAALFALDPPAPKISVAEAKEATHPLPRTSIEASQYPSSQQQQQQQQNAKQQMQLPQRKATVPTSSVAAVHEPIASSAPQTLIPRNAFAGPFEKGSLLASEAMKQPQLPPPSSLPQNQQQLGSWDNAAPIDLRVHERTRQRLMAEQRRQELLEVERARRRAREPLIQGIAMPAQHQQSFQPQTQGQPQPQAQAHQYRSRTSQQQPYQRR